MRPLAEIKTSFDRISTLHSRIFPILIALEMMNKKELLALADLLWYGDDLSEKIWDRLCEEYEWAIGIFVREFRRLPVYCPREYAL